MTRSLKAEPVPFKNRKEAGRLLAQKLRKYKNTDAIILALPRGGVPVAAEISHGLKIPLDILAVRKIGVPVFSEVAAGALCEDDAPYFSENLMLRLGYQPEDLKSIIELESENLKNQIQKFRDSKPLPDLDKKIVIIVDDGLATGATARAAARFLKKKRAAKIIFAVPVGAASSLEKIRRDGDEVVALIEPTEFRSVSDFYEDFAQVEDAEVKELLEFSRRKFESSQNIRENALDTQVVPLRKLGDFNQLIHSIKDSRIVMLGEASHGTHEYYQLRATISKKLITEHGFKFIAVEGDWPDAYRLHRYINGIEGENAAQVLLKNHRWPTWMWANDETALLAEWLREKHDTYPVGFFGLDVYSLFDSITEVVRYLQARDPSLAQKVQGRYACFDPFRHDEMAYAKSLFQMPEGCEKEVIENLQELLKVRLQDDEEFLSAQQNAYIIRNAENYYRSMINADLNSWNVRDTHMIETLDRLLARFGESSKAIIWAHNTHIGDYRATDMNENGYVNLGGLAREKYGSENVSLVGFGSYHGTVLAGRAWGAPERIMNLPEARFDSYEFQMHQIALQQKLPRFHLPLNSIDPKFIQKRGLQRAVGVVYDPDQEFRGNYVPTDLKQRYDHFIYIDKTHALRSLKSYASKKEFPETYPSGV